VRGLDDSRAVALLRMGVVQHSILAVRVLAQRGQSQWLLPPSRAQPLCAPHSRPVLPTGIENLPPAPSKCLLTQVIAVSAASPPPSQTSTHHPGESRRYRGAPQERLR
jgi:hypothetical protein